MQIKIKVLSRNRTAAPVILYLIYTENIGIYTHIHSPLCLKHSAVMHDRHLLAFPVGSSAKHVYKSSMVAAGGRRKHLYSVSTGKAVKSKSLKNPIYCYNTLLQDKASSKCSKVKQ